MAVIERLGLALLHQMEPERAHDLSLKLLRAGLVPLPRPFVSPRLAVRLAGIDLPNPLGLAAGYDKNAVALAALGRAGFGFLEVGAVTPLPQEGNERPRLFRLDRDRAVINRFGFNNEGMHEVCQRLSARPRGTIVGLNIGANRDSPDRAGDFVRVLDTCGDFVDFATVNVSSPNTERLRDLQGREALTGLLHEVMAHRNALPRPVPIFLKISPDLREAELGDIAELALEMRLDGIIATNTTLSRDGLTSPQAIQAGGMSGTPLFARSTRVLAQLSYMTDGQLPLIGVGGVASARDAYDKIRAGASAVQLYSALVYKGLSLVPKILRELDGLLAADGFSHVSEAVGAGRKDWL